MFRLSSKKQVFAVCLLLIVGLSACNFSSSAATPTPFQAAAENKAVAQVEPETNVGASIPSEGGASPTPLPPTATRTVTPTPTITLTPTVTSTVTATPSVPTDCSQIIAGYQPLQTGLIQINILWSKYSIQKPIVFENGGLWDYENDPVQLVAGWGGFKNISFAFSDYHYAEGSSTDIVVSMTAYSCGGQLFYKNLLAKSADFADTTFSVIFTKYSFKK